jgi:hypothetical protein
MGEAFSALLDRIEVLASENRRLRAKVDIYEIAEVERERRRSRRRRSRVA